MIETLESRRLFAISVTCSQQGLLEITGDAGNNIFGVIVAPDGQQTNLDGWPDIEVQEMGGGNWVCDQMQINNAGAFFPIEMIYIFCRAGDDNVVVNLSENFGGVGGVPSPYVIVLGEDGADTLKLETDAINGNQVTLHGGDGNDHLIAKDGGNVMLQGDLGNDILEVRNINTHSNAFVVDIFDDYGTNTALINGVDKTAVMGGPLTKMFGQVSWDTTAPAGEAWTDWNTWVTVKL